MKVVDGLQGIRCYSRPVVALGVFDGVHAGHREIIAFCVRRARAVNGTSVIVTFWPHPGKQGHLYSLPHRLRLLDAMGVDVCIVLRFTPAFSRISAADFVRRVLVDKIGARLVCVGNNFRFGSRAAGSVSTLKKYAALFGFGVRIFPIKKIGALPVSSSYIRRCVTSGDLKTARRLLGRPVSVFGTVERGHAYGRKIGFPTANVNPHHEVIPPRGVYAVNVMVGGRQMRGVCYIGPAPAFVRRGSTHRAGSDNVEVHIIGFKGDLYRQDIEVQFLMKLRDRLEFATSSGLKARIREDIHKAYSWFSRHP